MPLYALTCDGCGHRWDDAHPMRAPHPPCPQCQQPSRVDWTRQDAPRTVAHDLHGTRMVTPDTQCQPHEVRRLRKLYGDGVGHCWQDDGSVKFRHKDEAKRFYRRDAQIRRMFAEKKAAREEKGIPARKRPPRPRK